MNLQLKDKVALVTGAGQGIGRAGVTRFLEEEAIVYAADINRELTEEFPTEVDGHNRLGKALLELGRYAEARDAYAVSLRLDPMNTIAQKNHARLAKLNRERLRKAAPHLWERLQQGDEELAREVAQGVLVSHLTFVVEVLDFLEIHHDGAGFFDKEGAAAEKLTAGWQKRVLDEFRERYPESLILLYINHLDWELAKPVKPFGV